MISTCVLPLFIGVLPTVGARAPHRRARTGRVGNYVATSGEFLVAAVTRPRGSAAPAPLGPSSSQGEASARVHHQRLEVSKAGRRLAGRVVADLCDHP